jgi:peptide chain release factor 1
VSRIPPNEKRGRRHTSAVTVSVLPVPKAIRTVLNDGDVSIEFFRAGGKGGQHRNKTETAVRAVHRPTGLTAVIADERSQSTNRERALEVLSARVADRARRAVEGKRGAVRAAMHGSGDISERFRSYLWREGTVVDHSTGRTAPLKAVLDGDFSAFAA